MKIKKGLDKANQKFEKRINRLKKRILILESAVSYRKGAMRIYSDFIDVLLSEKRVTKDELKPVFKKRNKSV